MVTTTAALLAISQNRGAESNDLTALFFIFFFGLIIWSIISNFKK